MVLQLSPNEQQVLVDILQGALGSLRQEIYRTEAAEYHQMLKERETILQALLKRLEAGDTSTAAVG